jgi:hypothetical protein
MASAARLGLTGSNPLHQAGFLGPRGTWGPLTRKEDPGRTVDQEDARAPLRNLFRPGACARIHSNCAPG